jgi:hypothetical protein
MSEKSKLKKKETGKITARYIKSKRLSFYT